MSNLGWYFWVDYFKNIDYHNLSANKDTLQKSIKILLEKSNNISFEYPILGNIHFKATTTYPGAIIGSGYLHEIPDIDAQLIGGFYFDYTSGLPILPGSSVKGILRSAFRHKAYIKELLDDKINEKEVEELEIEIFESGKDIFFDAVIISKVQILVDDYLAPHKSLTKEPIPLHFLKIAPGVTFRFDFELHDSSNLNISAQEKRDLFMKIFQDIGIGAKTNVGYGHLEDIKPWLSKEEQEKEQQKEIEKAITHQDRDELLKFYSQISDPTLKSQIEQALKSIEKADEINAIKKAFECLDKTNKKHLQSFIDKYQTNPLAETEVQKAREYLNKGKEESLVEFDDLMKLEKFKELTSKLKLFIKHYSLNNEQKELLYAHILKLKDLPKKRKKFPFSLFNDPKCFGKELANQLAGELGLK